MSSVRVAITVRLRLRWWVPHYIRSICIFSILTGLTPNFEKISSFIILHGIKIDTSE